MTIKLHGTVKKVHGQETKGNFTFRNIWITVDGDTQYPQVVEVLYSGGGMALLDNVNADDEVEIDANIRGREYQGKVYVSLAGWKIAVTKKGDAEIPAKVGQRNEPETVAEVPDDLPF